MRGGDRRLSHSFPALRRLDLHMPSVQPACCQGRSAFLRFPDRASSDLGTHLSWTWKRRRRVSADRKLSERPPLPCRRIPQQSCLLVPSFSPCSYAGGQCRPFSMTYNRDMAKKRVNRIRKTENVVGDRCQRSSFARLKPLKVKPGETTQETSASASPGMVRCQTPAGTIA